MDMVKFLGIIKGELKTQYGWKASPQKGIVGKTVKGLITSPRGLALVWWSVDITQSF